MNQGSVTVRVKLWECRDTLEGGDAQRSENRGVLVTACDNNGLPGAPPLFFQPLEKSHQFSRLLKAADKTPAIIRLAGLIWIFEISGKFVRHKVVALLVHVGRSLVADVQ